MGDLEERTEDLIDNALDILKRYDSNAKNKSKPLLENKVVEEAFNKVIEIEQFILTHRNDYGPEKFNKYKSYLDMLRDLTEDTNSLKYYFMLES